MTVVIAKVQQTGSIVDAFLQSHEIFQVDFYVTGPTVRYRPRRLTRQGLTRAGLAEEYAWWNEQGYTIEPAHDSETFFQLLERYQIKEDGQL